MMTAMVPMSAVAQIMSGLTFKLIPADDDQVDPSYECVEHPTWAIQDASAYGGGYCLNEYAPEGEEEFWMREHGAFKSLASAKVALAITLAGKVGAA